MDESSRLEPGQGVTPRTFESCPARQRNKRRASLLASSALGLLFGLVLPTWVVFAIAAALTASALIFLSPIGESRSRSVRAGG